MRSWIEDCLVSLALNPERNSCVSSQYDISSALTHRMTGSSLVVTLRKARFVFSSEVSLFTVTRS